MNYQKIYDAIIQKRQNQKIDKTICICEQHHIIPKSLGGLNTEENLVNLTLREHYLCHRLLSKITLYKYGINSVQHFKMSKAIRQMSNYKKYKNFRSSRIYEKIRHDFIQSVGFIFSKANKNRKHTEEHIQKNRLHSLNRKWMYNKITHEAKFVKPELFEKYLNAGFVFGRLIDQTGEKNPIHNHTFTKQEREKRRISMQQINKKKLNRQTGKIWVNNGTKNKLVFPNNVPDGFIRGKLHKQHK